MGGPSVNQELAVMLKKKTRASKPKVKSGCGTCKIRHKKCDETKPVCKNCSGTGRICDGYIDPETGELFGGNQHRQVSRASPFNDLLLSPAFNSNDEAQAYLYFQYSTSAQLAFALQSRAWSTFILQMSHGFMPVKHVIIALGSFSRRLWLRGSSRTLDLDTYAREQYRRAIAILRKSLKGEQGDILHEKTLVTCFLFCMCEFMQGNPVGVQTHIKSGISLFEDFLSKHQDSLDPDCLIVRLARLLYMVETANQLWSDSPTPMEGGNDEFTALYTVDKWEGGTPEVEELSEGALKLIARESTAAYEASKDLTANIAKRMPKPTYTHGSKDAFTSTRRRQEGMYWRLEHWRSVVTKTINSDDVDAEIRYYRYHAWRMHYLYNTNKLNLRLKISDDDLQECKEDIFQDVLTSAERLQFCPLKGPPSLPYDDMDAPEDGFAPFPFSLGLTKPVLWVATNSQVQDTRDRAVNILMSNRWTDWDDESAEVPEATAPWMAGESSSSSGQSWSHERSMSPEYFLSQIDQS